MIYPWIYKKGTKGTIQKWTVEVDGNKYRSHSGMDGGKITINAWTVCAGKNLGKTNETLPNGQAVKEAEALLRKKLETGYYTDIKNINKKQYFEPMLARKYEDQKDKIKYPLMSQPKLDGIRCVVKEDGMWSRNGKRIVSCPHIYEELKPLFKKNPDLILDGELYADKFSNDFNKICSLVKKTKPTKDDLTESAKSIQYWIYDVPSYNKTFKERWNYLCDKIEPFILDNSIQDKITIVSTYVVNSEQNVLDQFEEYIKQGYEGQILRTIDGLYENKRSKSLMKHKEFNDDEYQVISVEEGKGLKSGMIGSVTLKTKQGKEFSSNFKLSHDELKSLWKEKKSLIGKMVTVQYFNLTPDGIPRFPYIIGIRDYE